MKKHSTFRPIFSEIHNVFFWILRHKNRYKIKNWPKSFIMLIHSLLRLFNFVKASDDYDDVFLDNEKSRMVETKNKAGLKHKKKQEENERDESEKTGKRARKNQGD